MTLPRQIRDQVIDAAVALMGQAGRNGTVQVLGDSMRPTLVPGDLLGVEFSPEALRRGDLLLFRQGDYLAVHRLLGRIRRYGGGSSLRTRGDGTPALDPPVDRARVVGRVIAARCGGEWRDLRRPCARAYALGLALHDLAWSAAAALAAGTVDRLLARVGVRRRLRDGVAAADRWTIRVVHRLLFECVHRPTVAPAGIADPTPPAP